ncbi:hypothetical protein [Ensifer adhaerens]|nr:hypothetical protein [Ensifer adhaerens]
MKASSWVTKQGENAGKTHMDFLISPWLFAHQVDEESLIVNGDIMP